MNNEKVCPVSRAKSLDMKMRRWVQNPYKILNPFIHESMVAVDYGCGPGFFTMDMAELVGDSGHVLAVDLQQGMLDIIENKKANSPLKNRISTHKCGESELGLNKEVDFILAFYVVHEVPDPQKLFQQLAAILKTGGKILVAEPPLHVSKSDFLKTLTQAKNCSLTVESRPKILLSKTALLTKSA